MPDATTTTTTFVLRRLADPLPIALTPSLQIGLALGLTLIGLALIAWRFQRTRSILGTPLTSFVAVLRVSALGLILVALINPTATLNEWGNLAWLGLTVAGLLLAVAGVMAMYAADQRIIGWRAIPLAFLRSLVFFLLAWAFLLPAEQTWERIEKKSKVIVVVDVSPSMSEVRDDPASTPEQPGPTRLEEVLDYLAEPDGLVREVLESNPLTVYRFGARLDEEGAPLTRDTAWTEAEWRAFLTYDFKAGVLRDLSSDSRQQVVAQPAWGTGAGDADWATDYAKRPAEEVTPPGLTPADAAALGAAREKLERRVDVARALAAGTNVPDSLTAVLRRESGNAVQGVIVLSDGRSPLASDGGIRGLRERAARDKVPVFTIAVGDPREAVRIELADVQAPEVVPPSEEFKVIVEADGIGLADATIPVTLDLYLPGQDVKTDAADHTLSTQDLVFEGGTDPPHGQTEFRVDPAALPEALTEPVPEGVRGAATGKRQLKQGAWQVVARTPRDPRETSLTTPQHASPPRKIEVLDRPTRILMFASGPTREYQTLRTLLSRETSQARATLSIYLQTAGGRAGTAVQDVPAERLLTRFPTRYDVSGVPGPPDERGMNLNDYDLIIAFDPDWSELSSEQIQNLETWVDTGGGGLIYVAGPLHTFQLARADEDGRLKPLLDLLPVVPDDIILVKTRPIPRSPRRLVLRPSAEYDVLRLADQPADDPTAGWEPFFTGAEKLSAGTSQAELATPKRGFFAYYPLKSTKPGSSTLAEFLDADDTENPAPKPWLVTAQASAGRTVFLGAGETWRFRAFDQDYFDRFWIKLARYSAGGRQGAGAARGRVLVAKEATSGSQLRVQVKLLAPNGKPYPADAIDAKFRIEQLNATGDKENEFGPFEMTPRLSGAGFDGYYAGQVPLDRTRFPAVDQRHRVVVDVPDSPGETLSADFQITRSDPELDQTRPDFTALEEMAGTLDEVRPRIKDPAVLEALRTRTVAANRLAFRLTNRADLALIPKCLDATTTTSMSRGPVRDLWDQPVDLNPVGLPVTLIAFDAGSTRVEIGWLLLAIVGLLGLEWLGRKLLRMA